MNIKLAMRGMTGGDIPISTSTDMTIVHRICIEDAIHSMVSRIHEKFHFAIKRQPTYLSK